MGVPLNNRAVFEASLSYPQGKATDARKQLY